MKKHILQLHLDQIDQKNAGKILKKAIKKKKHKIKKKILKKKKEKKQKKNGKSKTVNFKKEIKFKRKFV